MRKFIHALFVFLIALFSLISALTIYGATILYKYADSKIDDDLMNALSAYEQTKFFSIDRKKDMEINEEEMCEIFLSNGVKYEHVNYNCIPEKLINAFVAIEDKRFYTHNGIDFIRTGRAMANYLLGGKRSFGGSTITQQLVKNLTGNDKKIVDRKLKEAFCAIDIESRYEKSEIIEMYLNVINLAHGCRGVGAAARFYFSKNVKDLDLIECVCLASITNNPSKYDPISHPDENLKRCKIILTCMHDMEYINDDEYISALNREIVLNVSNKYENNINSWYIDAVIEDVITDLSNKYGISNKNASILLYSGGYKIYTNMDPEIQKILDDYFSDEKNFPHDEKGKIPQASMIIIDPYTGDVLGIAGAVGKKNGNRIQNYATTTKRPPGSAIKPLSIYAPAIDSGLINWSTVIEDSPVKYDEKGILWPSNANKKYIGNVNIKYAISHSLNTVAVKILNLIGNDRAYSFINDKLKISSLNEKKDIGDASLALGQPSRGITLRELTNAYNIFQNGYFNNSKTYYKVTDSNGKIILDNTQNPEPVISKETASIMTKLLQTVVAEGTASEQINLANDIEIAGKTGTTQYSWDKYFIGYTPSLLAGVWQGYDIPRPINCYNGNYSIGIWDDIMSKVYNLTAYRDEEKKFKISDKVQCYSYNKNTGLLPDEYDSENDIEYGWFRIDDSVLFP